jgi:hypothetical protein
MNDLTAVRTAIYAALTGAPATYPVYDPVPQGVLKPYIAFGPENSQPDEELQAATTDAALQIDTWSALSSRAQTYAMLQFIRARLDGQTIAGSWFVSEDFNEVLEDPASTASNRIYHGVARYRVRVG